MKDFSKILFFTLLGLLAGFVGGQFGDKVLPTSFDQVKSVEHYVEQSDTIEAIKIASNSVVSIVSFQKFENVPDQRFQAGGGTGFIVSEDGLILTNKHVLREGFEFAVVLNDGTQFEATVVDRDPFDDIAFLRIDPGEHVLQVAKLGDSDLLQVGQSVLSVGNALSRYQNTVTSGIISALARDISAFTDFRGGVENLSGLLQTDAAINFGSSGGPLLNLAGEVVGVNVAVAESANDIGFAIPINDIKPILDSVIENGEIVRPVVGVRFVMLTEEQAEEMDLDVSQGALLIGNALEGEGAILEGSAAEEAGLKAMDVILEVDGVEVTVEKPFHKVVREYSPGDTITLKIWREGKILEKDLTLKSNKELK